VLHKYLDSFGIFPWKISSGRNYLKRITESYLKNSVPIYFTLLRVLKIPGQVSWKRKTQATYSDQVRNGKELRGLIWAAKKGYSEFIHRLLTQDSNLRSCWFENTFPIEEDELNIFHIAVMHNHLSVIFHFEEERITVRLSVFSLKILKLRKEDLLESFRQSLISDIFDFSQMH
jgi:hypothetical protein